MILNEDYFDNLKLTDDDIESSEDDVPSSYNKYATPEEWFADMKSRYAHCIEIPLSREYQWKWNLPLILKRLFYVFDAYGMEYSEPTLQNNLQNGYSQCNFIDYNGYKLISNYYMTIEDVNKSDTDISVVIFFNFPEIHSYKAACVFISNIFSCIQNNSIKDMTYGNFIIWEFKTVPYARTFSRKYANNWMIERIIKLFFPEKKYDDIEEELADNNTLLNNLLRCFQNVQSNEMMSGSPQ